MNIFVLFSSDTRGTEYEVVTTPFASLDEATSAFTADLCTQYDGGGDPHGVLQRNLRVIPLEVWKPGIAYSYGGKIIKLNKPPRKVSGVLALYLSIERTYDGNEEDSAKQGVQLFTSVRRALKAAHELRSRFPDPKWNVELRLHPWGEAFTRNDVLGDLGWEVFKGKELMYYKANRGGIDDA